MPQACTTSKLHLAKAVAASSARDVTLYRGPSTEVERMPFLRVLALAYYVTHSHLWSCALHTTCSVACRGPTCSHTLQPKSQKWSHLLIPSISDISVKKKVKKLSYYSFSLKLLYWVLAQTPRKKRAHRKQRWVTYRKAAPSFIQALVPLPTLWVPMSLPLDDSLLLRGLLGLFSNCSQTRCDKLYRCAGISESRQLGFKLRPLL